jgi:hypothetical protein
MSVARSKPALSLVATVPPLAERIARLQQEARALATQHADQLIVAMAEVERLASEVVEVGSLHQPGVREIARRLADDMAAQARTIQAIRGRG